MPTSAAYARILVQQRKARLVPHPAVPLLRLSHVVPEPTLRPVLLALALHATTATVLALTEPGGDEPLLRLTLDLHHATTPAQRAAALTALARLLATLLPISQVAAHAVPVMPDATAAAAISTIIPTLQVHLPYPLLPLSPETPRMAADPLVRIWQQQMDRGHDEPTEIAAAYAPDHRTEQPSSVASGAAAQAVRLRGNEHHLRPGMVVCVRQHDQTVTGLVQAVAPHGAVQVRVPTAATVSGVSWADVTVFPPLHGWLWDAQSVRMLPVASNRHNREG
jgi:hypothetical protein